MSRRQGSAAEQHDVLQVVLYEMAGTMTADGISIETARGVLADALSNLTGGAVIGR